jgi:hypothetical protein
VLCRGATDSERGPVSAFEVSTIHVDALLSAAVRRDEIDGPPAWHHGEIPGTAPGEMLPGDTDDLPAVQRTRREISPATAGQWSAVLLAENRRSVNHRYAGDEYEEPYVFTEITGRLDPVAILKAISCYEYQSCEHPGWEASEARSFREALRRPVIRWLPGYAAAAWEITDPSEAEAVTGAHRSTA